MRYEFVYGSVPLITIPRLKDNNMAYREYTIYRFCDIGLLLGAWMSHLLFHESQRFSQLANLFNNEAMPPAGYADLLLLSSLILIAASGKSAQFPFCFWLPRAMEGPTPSSAIFYGALLAPKRSTLSKCRTSIRLKNTSNNIKQSFKITT